MDPKQRAIPNTSELLHRPSVQLSLGLLLLSILVKKVYNSKSRSHNQPPGPWKLPIIGNMHHLLTKLPHHAFGRLAQLHGPVMQLRMGAVDIVVVSSPEAASVIMKSQDLNFCSRPDIPIPVFLTYGGTDIVFSPYGEYWRQIKKICTVELLSAKRVRSFYSHIHEETSSMISEIYRSTDQQPINLSVMFGALMNNIIARCAFGSKSEDQQKFISAAKEGLEIGSGFSVSDLFPRIKFIDVLNGTRSKVKRIFRNLDDILGGIVRQHELKLIEGGGDGVEDLVDVLLRIKDQGELQVPLTIDNIKAVILDMFVGGTDTSSTVLAWAMSELMKNPQTMEKANAEVRQVLKGKTQISESDLGQLHYMKLVIKETLRLHPPIPLLIPRQCMNTCEVEQYTISAGTRVIVNAWAIGRDPGYWGEDAEKFNPERFMRKTVDFKGANYEFIPFGGGRRVCPGITFGETNVGFILAHLLLHFNWELPNGMEPEELDMTESFGVTAHRKTDLCLLGTRFSPCVV